MRALSDLIIAGKTQNSLKAIILTATIYYRERLQIKISLGKIHIGQIESRKAIIAYLPVVLFLGVTVILSWYQCVITQRILPTREVHLSLGVQSLHRGSITVVWLTAHHMVDLSFLAPQGVEVILLDSKSHPKSHFYYLAWSSIPRQTTSGLTFQRLYYLPKAKGKGQTFFWASLNSLLHCTFTCSHCVGSMHQKALIFFFTLLSLTAKL